MRGRRPRPLDDGTKMAGGQGLEPWFAGPEPAVLPLNDPPTTFYSLNLRYNVKKNIIVKQYNFWNHFLSEGQDCILNPLNILIDNRSTNQKSSQRHTPFFPLMDFLNYFQQPFL